LNSDPLATRYSPLDWTDGKEERIFVVTTGFCLVALDARTGVPVKSFGTGGAVDLPLLVRASTYLADKAPGCQMSAVCCAM